MDTVDDDAESQYSTDTKSLLDAMEAHEGEGVDGYWLSFQRQIPRSMEGMNHMTAQDSSRMIREAEAIRVDNSRRRGSGSLSLSHSYSSPISSNNTVLFVIDENKMEHATSSGSSRRGESWTWTNGSQPDNIQNRRRRRSLLHKGSVVEHVSRKSCLRPTYSLRAQMFLSFGVLSVLSIVLFVTLSIVTSYFAGNRVQTEAANKLDAWIDERLVVATSRYVADTVSAKFSATEGAALLIREMTLDRLRGFPNATGFVEDTLTPFLNHYYHRDKGNVDGDGGRSKWKYPLGETPIPVDWELPETHITEANAATHLGGRVCMYSSFTDLKLTTEQPAFFVPKRARCENQTECISKSKQFDLIRKRTSQFATPLLKSLYEYHSNVQFLGIYFVNDGYGAPLNFPGFFFAEEQSYTSIGCDWMREPNPLAPDRPIGTEEQIARCHKEGTRVELRDYNPLERSWCREQALNPDRVMTFGPYKDAVTGELILTFGRAIYDDITKELIATIVLDVSLDRTTEFMQEIATIPTAAVATVRWEDGVVLGAHPWKHRTIDYVHVWDLVAGVDRDTFYRMRMDWNRTWNAQGKSEHIVYKTQPNRRAAFHLSPKPPRTHDPSYKPNLMVLVTIDESIPEVSLNKLESKVEESINRLIQNTLLAGAVGLVWVVMMLYLVSLFLTHPLRWMRRVGDQILTNYVGNQAVKVSHRFVRRETLRGSPTSDNNKKAINNDDDLPSSKKRGEHPSNATVIMDELSLDAVPWSYKYAPKTEILKLVDQFRKMVKKFSGAGTAKLFKRQVLEVQNPFFLHTNFEKLYQSRQEVSFQYEYGRTNHEVSEQSIEFEELNTTPCRSKSRDKRIRIHWGLNSQNWEESLHLRPSSKTPGEGKNKGGAAKSPLFRWILLSITIPLLLTMIGILAYFIWEISASLPSLIDDVEEAHVNLDISMLAPFSRLRAHYVSELAAMGTRDLHVLTRFLSWMHFGAIPFATGTLPAMISLADECKSSLPNSCKSLDEAVCDCGWNDPRFSAGCTNPDGSRLLQKAFQVGLREDAWPNGDRNFTSYPSVGLYPDSTQFWGGVDAVPGAVAGPPLSKFGRFGNTFDRLRVIAAASTVLIPLYNYGKGGYCDIYPSWGMYMGYQADGMFTGYSGCDHSHASFAHFQSTILNKAPLLNPTMCPEGKYGYDARCRDWFVTGNKVAMEGEDPLYMTPLYLMAGSNISGISATLPLINENTGEYIGQTIVDMSLERAFEALTLEETPLANDGFHLLITSKGDAGSTLVGPGFLYNGGNEVPAEALVMHDPCAPDGRHPEESAAFQQIQQNMVTGHTGNTTFYRTYCDKKQTVHIAYAPVKVPIFRFLDPTNISAGAIEYNSTAYSLALAETSDGLRETFHASRGSIAHIVYVAIALLLAFIGFTFGVVVYLTSWMSMSITQPTSKLLSFVMDVNGGDMDLENKELPEITNGSREVAQIRETFEKLFMMVRFATTTFYTGDLYQSWSSFQEGLSLFKTLGNEKAVGIANNDLGIVTLAIYRTIKKIQVPILLGMSRRIIIQRGCQYFKDSIDAGEAALARINQEEGWSIHYLVFMQQLSNRYFNRAMFLLTVRDDHPDPEQAERQGLTDLATCKDMDCEVVDNGDREGFKGDLNEYFELLLSRIKGVLNLLKLGYNDEWGLDELFADARKALLQALDEPQHALFRNMAPAGQMQRFDSALIEYYTYKKNTPEAARIAIRMLMEDEYVIGEAALTALKALIDSVKNMTPEELNGEDPSDVQSKLYSYRSMVTEAISLQFSKKDEIRRASYYACNAGDFTMEFF